MDKKVIMVDENEIENVNIIIVKIWFFRRCWKINGIKAKN